jgi:protein-tyrosine phosphatase
MKNLKQLIVTGFGILLLHTSAFAAIHSAEVVRVAPDKLNIIWDDKNPVDIFETDSEGQMLKGAKALLRASSENIFMLENAGTNRRYFLLVDKHDNQRLEVAERLVPLAQGSNFRDIGGYASAGGKHVRWGLIYRSAGQPMLTPEDVEAVHKLNISQLVDLRSSEERVIAPSKISGIPYSAVGYSMMDLMKGLSPQQLRNGVDMYRNFPHMLAPQLKIIFAHLLNERKPIAYNCSAGQDRTGFVTAMILSALGVDNRTIVEDYHLSTRYRRPEYEMETISPALAASNPVAALFASYQKNPQWKVAQPLKTADGTPFLKGAFDEIHEKWGSVDAYLEKEIGLSPVQRAKLRALYLQ